MTFALTSTLFAHLGEIPLECTCEGQDQSPPLTWTAGPAGTKSFVLIVDDPDAPDPNAPKMTWVHWLLFNIPANVHELPAAIAPADLPAGTGEGLNDWKRTGYGGPCPPIGRHRYFFKLYALDIELSLQQPKKPELEQAIRGHVLAQTELIGTYQKRKIAG